MANSTPPGSSTPQSFDQPPQSAPMLGFAYRAQSVLGQPMSGTIEATGLVEARQRLEALGLRVIDIAPATPPKPRALRGEDFVAFNQQLAQLSRAGLPLEQGLRLIAQDMRGGRLARTVQLVADELDKGTPLGEAFARHHTQFPPLYGRLMDAGVRSGNLPGMLLNLSRHMELVYRMRAMLWRTMSYPLMVLAGIVIVVLFLSHSVLPKFQKIFVDFKMDLPGFTQGIISMGSWMPTALAVLGILLALWFILWPIIRASGGGQGFVEATLLPLPLIGRVLKRSLIARWCDAAKLGVDAGLDLPAAVELAGDAINSPSLRRDGKSLLNWLHGQRGPLDAPRGLRLLPATVPAAMAMAVRDNQLSTTLDTLSHMYQQQAEHRLGTIPAILGPTLLVLMTLVIGSVLLGLMLPLINLIQAASGPF